MKIQLAKYLICITSAILSPLLTAQDLSNANDWSVSGLTVNGNEATGLKGTINYLHKIPSNSVIEFEFSIPNETADRFLGVRFRGVTPGANPLNTEVFYLRAGQSGRADALQYAPNFNGGLMWQLYYHGAVAPAKFNFAPEWNKAKLVYNTDQLDVYINDMTKPLLTTELLNKNIQNLDSGFSVYVTALAGGVGSSTIRNIVINPAEPAAPMIEANKPLPLDVGTVSKWQLSGPYASSPDLNNLSNEQEVGIDRSGRVLPQKSFAVSGTNNIAVASFTVNNLTQAVLNKKMDFGFSNIVKLYLNGQLIYEGNDGMRTRDYFFLGTVGFYDAIYLNLLPGNNKVTFEVKTGGVASGGVSALAKFTDTTGLEGNFIQ